MSTLIVCNVSMSINVFCIFFRFFRIFNNPIFIYIMNIKTVINTTTFQYSNYYLSYSHVLSTLSFPFWDDLQYIIFYYYPRLCYVTSNMIKIC